MIRKSGRPGRFAMLVEGAALVSCLLAAAIRVQADEPGQFAPQPVSALSDFAADGEKLLARGDYAGAIEQFTEVLEIHPDTPLLLERRAAAYRLNGDMLLAEEDMAEAERLRLAPLRNLPPVAVSPADAASIGITAWLLLAGFNVVVGRKQMVEADGTMRRLLRVAAVAALLGLGPLLVWLALHASLRLSSDVVIVGCLTFLCTLWMTLTIRPTLRLLPLQKPLPLVDDQEFAARIAQMAAIMHIRPPRVRVWRTVGGQLKALAWAGGLVQPSLVITDGILHRLSGPERDAIVAHEMGHIANHSLWPLLSLFPLCSCVVPILEIWYPHSGFPVIFAFLLLIGLRRLVSRPIEADCDRRAARAIGYREAISALAKIHAALPLRSQGWLPMLGFAMATHPSRDVRLSLLYRAWQRELTAGPAGNLAGDVPAEPIQGFVYSPRQFWAHRSASCVALLAWLAVLPAAIIWSHSSTEDASILLLVAVLVPSLPLLLSVKPEAKRVQRRMQTEGGTRWRLIGWITLKLTVLMMATGILGALLGLDPVLSLSLIGCLCVVLFVVPMYRRQKLLQRIHAALEERDFSAAIRLAGERPKLVARYAPLRYLVAVVDALHGDQSRGTAELEKLTTEYPRYALPQLALADLYVDRGHAEPALAIAEGAQRRFRKDPAPLITRARALRRLGRPLESRVALEQALRLDSSLSAAHAIAAAVALDLGELELAQQSVQVALELGPGEILVLAVAAELAVATAPVEQARLAIQQAIGAIRANPFSTLATELAWLEAKLQALEGKSAGGSQSDAVQEPAIT